MPILSPDVSIHELIISDSTHFNTEVNIIANSTFIIDYTHACRATVIQIGSTLKPGM